MTLAGNGASQCDVSTGPCHLCGDEAHIGRIVMVDGLARTATVFLAGGTATVALDLVDARAGDEILIHLGFAIELVTRA